MSEQQSEQIQEGIGTFGVTTPVSAEPGIPVAVPQPDEKWDLPHGKAWVYYGEGNRGLVRPVLLADGFNAGPTDFPWFYQGLETGGFPLVSSLRHRGRDLVLIGFDERSTSILTNARAVIAAVRRTITERLGDGRLTVGGFSMGGIITRYALAKLEHDRMDHQTALYISYDSPHRGSVVPVALQAFAHFIPVRNRFSQQMNSPAARQMLWRHYDSENGSVGEDLMRKEFLRELANVGNWPQIPRTIGVANGAGDGTGNGVPPAVEALRAKGLAFPGTVLCTQGPGPNRKVADLRRLIPPAAKTVTTDDLPELDGAPGGTLESFGILADALNRLGGKVEAYQRTVCFVPSVSAVAVRDLDRQSDLCVDIGSLPPEESELDEFLCASSNEPHTAITEELGTWILDRLPD